ncbi:hypothetical protein SAMN05216467_2523 [Cellulomonas sp. KH9]|nr:hypothetical protein SAMN05216467_2523 [Cellulomonas sp. KH9]
MLFSLLFTLGLARTGRRAGAGPVRGRWQPVAQPRGTPPGTPADR